MLLFLVTSVIHSQNFKPFRSLQIIKTEHFDIIFPKESELTAYTLSGFADEAYNEIHTLLGINLRRRIPVVITPDTDQFNGYMNSIPSPHIILFDTPLDLEFTSYENSLRGLFFHELTHVFSLNSRSPFFETLNRIFGGWVLPTILNSSLFMVEGATVSFESLSGFGRANDPLIKQEIRQAVYEKNTLTPFQLSGVYDLPPNQSSYYEYGGLFSAYLQQRYGMEKYAEFWQLMGKRFRFSFNVYNSGLYRMFNEVYDVTFMQAWADFLDTFVLDNVTKNDQIISFDSRKSFINVLASSRNEVFFGNQLDRELMRYNPQTETIDKLMNMDSSVYDMAVSPDGTKLLLSSYRYKDALASAVVTEYNISNGKQTGKKWEGLYRGQYFQDGVIGISSDLHNNNIVYRTAADEEEILLRGNEEIMYTTPHAINAEWIIYVRSVKGARELCMFNYETKKEYILQSNLEDDVLRWKYIRNLRVSNDQVLFVYNHDDRMYKLGAIDLSQFTNEDSVMKAAFSSIDFSGGVFLPALVGEQIFYRGFFSDQDKLLKFPESMKMLSGTKTEISLVLNDEHLSDNVTAENAARENMNRVTSNIPVSKTYFAFRYMNPFQFWLPMPLIRTTESFISFDGLGIMSVMMDPTDTNTIILSAIGDWKAKMANITVDWNNNYFGFPLTLSFSDGVDLMYGSDSYRQTQASLSGTFSRSLGNERNHLTITSGINFSISADNPFDGSSAYSWSYDETQFSGTLGLGWSNLYRYIWQLFGTGMDINMFYRTPFDFSQKRIDGIIDIAFEKVFPLRFQFYGAYDTNGMNLQGNSRSYGSYFPNVSSVEYLSPRGLNAEWIGGGQVEVSLFNVEIQKNLSHLYFNRIYSTLSYRGVAYNGNKLQYAEGNSLYQDVLLAQSLVLRLGFESSIIPVKSNPIKLIPSIWGAWKISNMNDGKINDFYFNVGFEYTL
jgi:hypothetical protein